MDADVDGEKEIVEIVDVGNVVDGMNWNEEEKEIEHLKDMYPIATNHLNFSNVCTIQQYIYISIANHSLVLASSSNIHAINIRRAK